MVLQIYLCRCSTHLVSYFENTNDREFFLHVSCFSEGDVSAEGKNAEHFLDKVRSQLLQENICSLLI